MINNEENTQKTSLNLNREKYRKFRAIAIMKYKKDMVTSAFDEAMDLFIEKNKKLLLINDHE